MIKIKYDSLFGNKDWISNTIWMIRRHYITIQGNSQLKEIMENNEKFSYLGKNDYKLGNDVTLLPDFESFIPINLSGPELEFSKVTVECIIKNRPINCHIYISPDLYNCVALVNENYKYILDQIFKIKLLNENTIGLFEKLNESFVGLLSVMIFDKKFVSDRLSIATKRFEIND